MNRKRIYAVLALALMVMLIAIPCLAAEEAEEYVSFFGNSIWAIIPPVVAIVLALITKEVYSSLFLGVLVGAGFYAVNAGGVFNFETFIQHAFIDGFVGSISDSYNVGILIFLVLLGAMVALMNKAGGSAAFGKWAKKHIKSRIGAQLTTIIFGILIFIDDYFNCLTVGSVMRPVTDEFKVSRAKLAYLIDATAAPVCIIAPISSWAAAVAGFASDTGMNGLQLFISAIPYNFYALLTIVMMITITVLKFDFGPMKKHEDAAFDGNIFYDQNKEALDKTENEGNAKGKVIDLVLPVVVLIIACVIGMIYSGGFFSGETFVNSFANSDASVGLVFGSFAALIFTIIYMLARRVLNFTECMECVPEGFKAMVPAIMILVCAWTLKAMTDSLGAADYIAGVVNSNASALINFLPAIIFLIGVGLSFATGTSWGTFGILIPIVIAAFGGTAGGEMTIIAISACMAGAVCGDHCSPISDTTIMSSAGAQCNHINHVSTQLPYAMTVAAVSFVCYVLAGFVRTWLIMLPISIVLMIGTLLTVKLLSEK